MAGAAAATRSFSWQELAIGEERVHYCSIPGEPDGDGASSGPGSSNGPGSHQSAAAGGGRVGAASLAAGLSGGGSAIPVSVGRKFSSRGSLIEPPPPPRTEIVGPPPADWKASFRQRIELFRNSRRGGAGNGEVPSLTLNLPPRDVRSAHCSSLALTACHPCASTAPPSAQFHHRRRLP